MNDYFFYTVYLEIVIFICLLNTIRKNGDHKIWNILTGITIANLIANVLAFIVLEYKSMDLGDFIYIIFNCGLTLILNLALLITGRVLIKKQSNIVKFNKIGIITLLITLIINIFLVLFAPFVEFDIKQSRGKQFVIEYLNTKYGESNYEIKDINEEINTDLFNVYISGYYFEVKCDYMDDTFIVETNSDYHYILKDYFTPVYYSQKYNLSYSFEYIADEKKYNTNFDEFDDLVRETIMENYPLKSEEIRPYLIYEGWSAGWISNKGAFYDKEFYFVPEKEGKIPELSSVIDNLANSIMEEKSSSNNNY